ncbi:MAG: retroviral-like aspartic protease family protein [Saprospiraceae bacterium]|nr:retroviral-like aspartic protease family protein [Saprospiraceae bacterium]
MSNAIYFLPFVFCLWMTSPLQEPGLTTAQPGLADNHYYSEIPFRMERGKILVTVRIGNADRTFLVDTGAPFMVDVALAEEMGYTVVGSKGLKDAAGNTTRVNTLEVPELVLGEVRFSNLHALVYDFHNSLLGCFGIDGIIGSNLLSKSVIQFDWKAGRMILTDDAHRLGLEVAESIKIRVDKKQSSPYVPVRLQERIRIWSLLDTGSDDFYTISQQDLAAVQAKGHLTAAPLSQASGSASLGLIGGNDSDKELLIDAGSLALEQVRVAANVAIESNQDQDSRLGTQLLERGTLTIDYKKRRVWFVPYPDLPDYQYSQFGLGFVPVGDYWIIKEVWSGSEAAEEGVVNGDTLLHYGRIDMTANSVCDVLFQLPAEREADSLQVVVKHVHPGEERGYTLKKRVYSGD